MSYITYKCCICYKTFILLDDEVNYSEKESQYLTCPYHGSHKKIKVAGKYDSLKKCMDHDSHKRKNGKMVQKHWG